jgi:2-polyprenyl-3-methyl-5-hydroxy-6-metoxy-1,4-benzoquinol methylase
LKNSVDADEYILMTESARADVEFPEKLETVEGEEVYDVGTIKTHTYFPEVSATEYTRATASELFSASNVGLEILRYEVRQEYTEVADTPDKGFHFHTGIPLAKMLGYNVDWYEAISPAAVESFAGTGNPFSLGEIWPGDYVVDVGSGAGFDSLIAGHLVGPTGRVVGVDMTPAMLHKARAAAAETGLSQVEFKEGYAESLPLPDGWADVVISNGVVNLCPDKLTAFGEMYRILKPGGRLQIADIMVQKAIPEEAKKDIDLWTG